MVNLIDSTSLPVELRSEWRSNFYRHVEFSRENARYSSHAKRFVWRNPEIAGERELFTAFDGVSVIKYLRAREALANYVEANFRTLFAPALFPTLRGSASSRYVSEEVVVSRGGLTVIFHMDTIHNLVGVAESVVRSEFSDVATFADAGGSFQVLEMMMNPPTPAALGAPFMSAVQQARGSTFSRVFGFRDTQTFRLTRGSDGLVPFEYVWPLVARRFVNALPLDRDEFLLARERYLTELRRETYSADLRRRADSAERFQKYWDGLKQRIASHVDSVEVRSAFGAVRMPSSGAVASRTWGIEVESANATGIDRPPGWERKYDGSLEPVYTSYSDCDCECDSCSEYDEHSECSWDNHDEETAEFVSPVLTSYHSRGLRDLCNAHLGRETNSTPGIHIHVGADGLTNGDVSRLVRMYSAISPFLWELTMRETRGYCKDIDGQSLTYWMGKEKTDVSLRDLASEQPSDRYKDVNTHALYGHGTIEFRAMGPVYDYKHLVRWAWLMRELVNLSRIEAVLPLFMRAKSFADVLSVVHQYGSETFAGDLPVDVDSVDLVEV